MSRFTLHLHNLSVILKSSGYSSAHFYNLHCSSHQIGSGACGQSRDLAAEGW